MQIVLELEEVQKYGLEEAFLLSISKQVSLPITKLAELIADRLNVSYWHVYRKLKKMQEEGIIDMPKSRGVREAFGKLLPYLHRSQVAWVVKEVLKIDEKPNWDVVIDILKAYQDKPLVYVIQVIKNKYWELKHEKIRKENYVVAIPTKQEQIKEEPKYPEVGEAWLEYAKQKIANGEKPSYAEFMDEYQARKREEDKHEFYDLA